MRSLSLSVIRPLLYLFWLPWLTLFAVFLICYSPFYLLFSLIPVAVNKNKETKRTFENKTGKPSLAKLEVKHA